MQRFIVPSMLLPLFATCICGCASMGHAPPPGPSASGLVSLEDSAEPFRERFNAGADRPRFVAILSSTCGPCVSGAVTTNEAILKGFGNAPPPGIDVHVVWIDVLPSDSSMTAAHASALFDDPRVAQYHDPRQLLGNAFAAGLLSRPPAWDIYLFYPAGAKWEQNVPASMIWMHQLGGGAADMSRYRAGSALAAEMWKSMQALGFESANDAPTDEQLARARAEANARIAAARSAATEGTEAAALGAGQCPRCAQSSAIGQCSISGWRYVVAQREKDEDGSLSNRFALTGVPVVPVELDAIDPSDARREFSVKGMACPDCALAVVGESLKIRGVTRVDVDYDAGRLIVYSRDEPGARVEMLPMQLNLAGFTIAPIDE